jgi:5-methyltetrahydrofolate--homocysteine methyltransferase
MMRHVILIGEKINYSIPRMGRLLDARDYDAVRKVARTQEERGADYIDVNVGPLSPEAMGDVVGAVRGAVSVPLCIDSTDPALLEAGLAACAAEGTGRAPGPILNSAIERNAARVLSLKSKFDCQVVLLVSERFQRGMLERNVLPAEAADTAKRLFEIAREAGFGPGEIYIDPGMPPVATDMEGLVNTALETIDMVSSDPDMGDAHVLVGISNFTAGLPGDVRLPLQNAFLTLAMRKGLDTMIGDPAREYGILETGDPYLAWLERILSASGAGRLEELASSPLYRDAPASHNRKKPPGGRERGDTP